jgi:toxin ParE1/3/4
VRVIWSTTAKSHLQHIYAYLEVHSPNFARRTVDRLVFAADLLGDFSEMGRVVPELDDPGKREVIDSPYRIIYWVRNGYIEIIAVAHSAQGELPPLP